MISSRTNRSSTALMMLLFIWVVIVLAVPKASVIIADKVYRVPSVQETEGDKDAVRAQIMSDAQERVTQYIGERRDQLTQEELHNEIARTQEEMTISIVREVRKIQVDYEKRKTAQFRLAANISRVSPASAYTYAATGLARTDYGRQERFLAAARSYQPGFVQYYNEMIPKMMEQQAQRTRGEEVREVKFSLDELPALDFPEASFYESWSLVVADFLILFLLFACLFMIAYIGFVRSDVQ